MTYYRPPSHGMWLDWRPVEELTDEELKVQSRETLAFTSFGIPNGTLAHEEWVKVLARGLAISRVIRERRKAKVDDGSQN